MATSSLKCCKLCRSYSERIGNVTIIPECSALSSVCHGQDDFVSCPDNDIDNIRCDLNPFITKLELTGNSFMYINNMQLYPRYSIKNLRHYYVTD